MRWADASPKTAKPLGPLRGALASLRGQHRCDLRPTASNLMEDESLEEEPRRQSSSSYRYLYLRYRYYFQ